MLIKDEKFRNLYRSLIILKSLNKVRNREKISKLLFNNSDNDNSIKKEVNSALLYPYVDHNLGMRFLVVATALIKGKKVKIHNRDNNFGVNIFTRDEIYNNEFRYVNSLKINKSVNLAKHINFAESILKKHLNNEKIEIIRNVISLDALRDSKNPDDVSVLFSKKKFYSEKILVKLEKLDDGFFKGVVLNQPQQDFGINCGDEINVVVRRNVDNKIICLAQF